MQGREHATLCDCQSSTGATLDCGYYLSIPAGAAIDFREGNLIFFKFSEKSALVDTELFCRSEPVVVGAL